MSVHAALFRLYRQIMVWFLAIIVALEGVILLVAGPLSQSLWAAVAGSGAKYWLLTVGILLIATNLRQFIGNGVTRHEFARGAAVFGLTIVVGFAVFVTLGRALEGGVLALTGNRAAGYPAVSPAGLLTEFAHLLPVCLGYLMSGALIALGFVRFRPWKGMLLLIPAALPLATGDSLVGLKEGGFGASLLSYLPAVTITVAVILLAAVAFFFLVRDVPIRRTRG